jgi:hypothetical protein
MSARDRVHTFEVPQCNVDTTESAHEYSATSVEAQAPTELPDVFNVSDESRDSQ